jgi:hypothetical protein
MVAHPEHAGAFFQTTRITANLSAIISELRLKRTPRKAASFALYNHARASVWDPKRRLMAAWFV